MKNEKTKGQSMKLKFTNKEEYDFVFHSQPFDVVREKMGDNGETFKFPYRVRISYNNKTGFSNYDKPFHSWEWNKRCNWTDIICEYWGECQGKKMWLTWGDVCEPCITKKEMLQNIQIFLNKYFNI
tara:strand:- start:73 stop:450 length:378 start_codon:yes stop_codon:yes gene_type:complete